MFSRRIGGWFAVIVVGLALGAAGSVRAEAISFASLSGCVYSDINGDAVRGAFEWPIAGVTIMLSGVDQDGIHVSLSALTDDLGDYHFVDLRPGTYALTEIQPERYVQGKPNAVGAGATDAGEIVDCDRFKDIVLSAGDVATGYNFGEWGIKTKYINKKPFLMVVPEPSSLALCAMGLLALLAVRRRARC